MESIAVRTSQSSRPWAFLSPDLLLIITGHLHHATDFVRFHAVCRPWRDAVPSLFSPAAPRKTFMPWILSQPDGRIMHYPVIYLGHIASEGSPTERNSIILTEPGDGGIRNWVVDADGWAAWLFASGPDPTLSNLVTGAIRSLPPFPVDNNGIEQRMSNPLGIVYNDGNVFLYNFFSNSFGRNVVFLAAILNPGTLTWTVVEKRLDLRVRDDSCAVYHDGKILLWVGMYHWCVLTPNDAACGGDIDGGRFETTWDELQEEKYVRFRNYILESRGELFRASVLLERKGLREYIFDSAPPTLEVSIHAMEEVDDDSGKKQWVERDNRSLHDRVFFLGSPTSFAKEAAELGMDGGCAYFVFNECVVRYNLITRETKPMEGIYPECGFGNMRVWLRPQPTVAPILEIRERLEKRKE
ncbi:unnamed protein product [Alopecurus aequalis]